jgi:hypothetical protein
MKGGAPRTQCRGLEDNLGTVRFVTGTTDNLANSDCGGLVIYNNAPGVAVMLPQAGAGGNFMSGWMPITPRQLPTGQQQPAAW